ncbi:hypothetical protein TNCV_656201 [Trichonephila clavipes]|nr:hypothetical protein TNCV_656201 [Trichonephila clavipes]
MPKSDFSKGIFIHTQEKNGWTRLGGVVGLVLALYTQVYGFDPGPSRLIFMMQKIDIVYVIRLSSIEFLFRLGVLGKIKHLVQFRIIRAQVPPSGEAVGEIFVIIGISPMCWRTKNRYQLPWNVLGIRW